MVDFLSRSSTDSTCETNRSCPAALFSVSCNPAIQKARIRTPYRHERAEGTNLRHGRLLLLELVQHGLALVFEHGLSSLLTASPSPATKDGQHARYRERTSKTHVLMGRHSWALGCSFGGVLEKSSDGQRSRRRRLLPSPSPAPSPRTEKLCPSSSRQVYCCCSRLRKQQPSASASPGPRLRQSRASRRTPSRLQVDSDLTISTDGSQPSAIGTETSCESGWALILCPSGRYRADQVGSSSLDVFALSSDQRTVNIWLWDHRTFASRLGSHLLRSDSLDDLEQSPTSIA